MDYNRTLQGLLMCLFGFHKYEIYDHTNGISERKMCSCCLKQYERTLGWSNKDKGDWILIRSSKIFTDIRITRN